MTPFTSLRSPPVQVQPPQQTPPLKEAPPPQQLDGPHIPKERTIDIFVSFKLRSITAEFPTVSYVCLVYIPKDWNVHCRIWLSRHPGISPSPLSALRC